MPSRRAFHVPADAPPPEELSPLKYRHPYPVFRYAMVDDQAPRLEARWFTTMVRETRRGPGGQILKRKRKETIVGAGPHVIAFLDYHLVPTLPGEPSVVGIDFVLTREDRRREGCATTLIAMLYAEYPRAPWIDWGNLYHPAIERLFARYTSSDQGVGPNTVGNHGG